MSHPLRLLLMYLIFYFLLNCSLMAQSVSMELVSSHTAGNESTLLTGTSPEFRIRLTSNADYYRISNGFVIYSDDGATWTTTIADTNSIGWDYKFDLLFEMKSVNSDGQGIDTVIYRGTRLIGTGLEAAFDDIAFVIKLGPIPISADNNQKSICIDALDSPPNELWVWANPETVPAWEGPYCFTIIDEMTTLNDINLDLPVNTSLKQNYPNPFNPSTSIEFELPEKTNIRFSIYTITGQMIYLKEQIYSAGQHTVVWDGADYSSGVYLYQLKTANFTSTRKMVLLK